MKIVTIIIVAVELLLIGIVTLLMKRTARKNVMSFQETLDLTDLPIVTFYNNGYKLNFILDSGATESIINKEDINKYTYETLNEKRKMLGIEGNDQIIENLIHMTIRRRDKEFEEDFQVTDMSRVFEAIRECKGVPIHGILGTSFFTKYKYILDFDELAAYTH